VRYYLINITNPKTGKPVLPSSMGGEVLSSLTKFGTHNPAALNIEFDLAFHNNLAPDNNAWLRIWGLSIKDIGSAFDLNGMTAEVFVGMSKGLPLAKPDQQGLILRGMIFQAFGNWVGLEQTLDLNFAPESGGTAVDKQLNFAFTWKKGEEMSEMIARTLKTAMPNFKQIIKISKNIVLNHDEPGYYQSTQQFTDYLNPKSKAILKKEGYQGVSIATDGKTVYATDGTVKSDSDKGVKEIAFEDMIGQPTWINTHTISVKTVLRGDLAKDMVVKIPPGPSILSIASQSAFNPFQNPANKTSFQGKFRISSMHHYGNFRQPDAASWNTTFEAIAEEEPKK
jgi:hypothetical protein